MLDIHLNIVKWFKKEEGEEGQGEGWGGGEGREAEEKEEGREAEEKKNHSKVKIKPENYHVLCFFSKVLFCCQILL